MEFKAKAQFQRVSPQKARLVLDLIKGKRVEDALTTLQFTKKRIAPVIFQLVRSAVENANYLSGEKGLDVDVDRLFVKSAIANDGPRMKRIRPAPMGRAYRYQRRMSHIIILVAERKPLGIAETVGDEATKPAVKRGAGRRLPSKKAVAKRPAKKKAAAKTDTKKKSWK